MGANFEGQFMGTLIMAASDFTFGLDQSMYTTPMVQILCKALLSDKKPARFKMHQLCESSLLCFSAPLCWRSVLGSLLAEDWSGSDISRPLLHPKVDLFCRLCNTHSTEKFFFLENVAINRANDSAATAKCYKMARPTQALFLYKIPLKL